jgi:hypothetical protein
VTKKLLKNPMSYIFLLFISDYLLTHYGISIGAIYEGNKLWVAILDLPIYLGLPFRVLYFAVLIYIPVRICLAHPDKCRPIFLKAFYAIAIVANLLILGLHINWIIIYTRVMT